MGFSFSRSRRILIVLKAILSCTGCLLMMAFGTSNLLYAQGAIDQGKDQDLAQMQLADVHIEAQTIGQLFSHFALSYRVPVGVEMAFNDNALGTYQLDLQKGTLSDLLTQFATRHDRYAWGVQDGVVNIYPKDIYRDVVVGELLEAEIGSFSVKEGSSCRGFEDSIANTAEVKKILKANGVTYQGGDISGFYIQQLGRRFTLDVSNTTVKAILNKVIKESPIAKAWVIQRDGTDQTFFINTSANFEESPTSYNGRSGSARRILAFNNLRKS